MIYKRGLHEPNHNKSVIIITIVQSYKSCEINGKYSMNQNSSHTSKLWAIEKSW